MSSQSSPTKDFEPPAGEDLYRRWLEWVKDNLGSDSHLASLAARAATETASQGAGFEAAVDAARKAWVSERTSQGGREVDWPQAAGCVLMSVSIPALIALAIVLTIASLAFQNCDGPIVICPDMCGGPQGGFPALSADVTHWTPGGGELAGTITASAGPTCLAPSVQVGFFDANGAAVGAIEIDFVSPVGGDSTLDWDVKFWPPPSPATSSAYSLADGTAIKESDGLAGPIPAAAVAARVVNATCVIYAGGQ